MDDTSAFLATDGDDNTPQNSRDFAAEWGPSDFDVRHRLVAVGDVGRAARSARSALCRALAGERACFTAQSGRPFTPRVSFDNSNTGNIGGGTFAYDRPNVVTGTVPPGAVPVTYDGQTFVIAPQYTFGNAGRNSLTGPGYASLDCRRVAAASRSGSSRTLELRLEIFNALNRQNFQLPDSFVDRADVRPEPVGAAAPRQLQLAARFTF